MRNLIISVFSHGLILPKTVRSIDKVDIVLIFFTKQSLQSQWVDREIKHVLREEREMQFNHNKIISIFDVKETHSQISDRYPELKDDLYHLMPKNYNRTQLGQLISAIWSKHLSVYKQLPDNTKISIDNHPVLISLKQYSLHKKIKIKDDFLSIKYNIWFKYLEQIISSNEFKIYTKQKNSNKLYNYVINKQEDAISDYEEQWRDAGFTEQTITVFRNTHDESLKNIMSHLTYILTNQIYDKDEPNAKLIAFLNAHLFMLDLTKNSTEQAIKDGKLVISKN